MGPEWISFEFVFELYSAKLCLFSIFCNHDNLRSNLMTFMKAIWMPPSLSELTQMISDTGLTHLGLEASIWSDLPRHINSIIINKSFLWHFEARFMLKDWISQNWNFSLHDPIEFNNLNEGNENFWDITNKTELPFILFYNLL